MTGSYVPCEIETGSPAALSRSSSNPSTCGMKPLMATIPAGRGRDAARPSEYDMTAPCEKPPSTVRSIGTPASSRAPSSQADAAAKVSVNVGASG